VHGEAFRRAHPITTEQAAVLRAIERCRTADLGGHLDVCTACGYERPAYNSCRNRHCPKCQSIPQAEWTEGRLARVLPVHYFHVVFTLPAQLRAIAMCNRRAVFDLLFASASATLLDLGRDPKRLGAQLGITMVLHTWARDLQFHPHVHCVVTGGGLSPDGARWIRARRDYLFALRVMGALFRGKFLASLCAAHARGEIRIPATDDEANPDAFARLRDKLYGTDWIVYAKRPFGGPQQVVRYLGRYTHRVGISNQRLVAMTDDAVTFRTKAGKSITLSPSAFLGRFIQHVLPAGFVKIRHYGLVAAANATTKLETARALLQPPKPPDTVPTPVPILDGDPRADWRMRLLTLTGIDLHVCPTCRLKTIVQRPLPIPVGRAPPEAA
jgi:hypothetical protein